MNFIVGVLFVAPLWSLIAALVGMSLGYVASAIFGWSPWWSMGVGAVLGYLALAGLFAFFLGNMSM